MRIKSKATAIYGLKGTGKSNFTQWLLSHRGYQAHLMYDVCREHDALNRYIPTHRRGEKAKEELQQVTAAMVTDVDRDRRPELLAIEEVSRFSGPNSPPPEAVYEIVDLARHYGVGLITIGRRPAQVHTDFTELADNLIIFRLTGKNDKRRLNQEVEGLGDVVEGLPDYHFVHVRPDRSYRVCRPVPEMDTTGRL